MIRCKGLIFYHVDSKSLVKESEDDNPKNKKSEVRIDVSDDLIDQLDYVGKCLGVLDYVHQSNDYSQQDKS